MLLGLSLGHEAQSVSSGPEEAEEPTSSSLTYRRGVKVLLIGATGATGQILMREALEQGHEVTALARNPSAVAPEDHRPRVLQGNALDASEVEAAVAGQDAVLSALGTRAARVPQPFSRRVR